MKDKPTCLDVKVGKMSLWTKVRLWFKPWIVGIDTSKDGTHKIYAKQLGGVVYVIKTRHQPIEGE